MTQPRNDESYAELLGRLRDDGEAFARARIELYRETAKYRAKRLRLPALLLLVASSLVASAVVALAAGFVVGLAPYLGGIAAGFVVALVAILIAGLLTWLAINRYRSIRSDPVLNPPEVEAEPVHEALEGTA